MSLIWLSALSFLLLQATSQMIQVSEDWSEWSKCSDSCGACGMQNRTLALPNGTRVVHVRHCNPKLCVDKKEPCCEPFKSVRGKCMIQQRTEGDEPKSDDTQNQRKEAALAWENIKDDADDTSKLIDKQKEMKEEILVSENFKRTKFPIDKKFINISPKESYELLNLTDMINSDLNDTRNANDNLAEGSGEFDEEIDNKINSTEIRNMSITNADALLVSMKKNKGDGKGYDRKDYKQRQRRNRQHLPRTAAESQNVEKSERSQKMFDDFYTYDYYDFYYYY